MPKTFTWGPAGIQTLLGVCANPLPGLERPVAFIVHCRFYWAYAIKHFLQYALTGSGAFIWRAVAFLSQSFD
jgi:hypothetical protein